MTKSYIVLRTTGTAPKAAIERAEAYARSIAADMFSDGSVGFACDFNENGTPIDSDDDFAAFTIEVDRVR